MVYILFIRLAMLKNKGIFEQIIQLIPAAVFRLIETALCNTYYFSTQDIKVKTSIQRAPP